MGRTNALKTNGNFKYSVNADNAVEIWKLDAPEEAAPTMRQPYPPGNPTPFASVEEAEAWAEAYLTDLQTPKPVEEVVEETL